VVAATQLDHIVPIRPKPEGMYDPETVQSLCRPHNSQKSCLEMAETSRSPYRTSAMNRLRSKANRVIEADFSVLGQ
jgi:hypothetical protein